MMKNSINFKRVLLGGLITGMIINVIDTPNGALISGPKITEFLTAHGLTASPFVAPYFLSIHLIFGILLVWAYANMIPQMGETRQNALYATLLILIPTRFFSLGFTFMGLLPLELFLTLSSSVVIGFFVGGIVGCWFYSRPSDSSQFSVSNPFKSK
jgi:hypothetical protein